MPSDFAFGVNSHAPEVLAHNLTRSPCLSHSVLHVVRDAPSAAIGYNRILDRVDSEYAVLLHHDVYLPEGWDKLLAAQIEMLERRDPHWAVMGAYGIAEDGRGHGPVWSSSLGMIVGRVTPRPVRSVSVDELLIVLNMKAGLRFDEKLPDWHLYGTDIVQTARQQGFSAYAGALPCIHNDGYKPMLGKGFLACYDYLARKWRNSLPLTTPVIRVTRTRLSFMREAYRMQKGEGYRRAMATDTSVPAEDLAAMCGWLDVSPRVDLV